MVSGAWRAVPVLLVVADPAFPILFRRYDARLRERSEVRVKFLTRLNASANRRAGLWRVRLSAVLGVQ